ncbi:MAG: hypothetical protein SCARUB_03408 [Candidatus Scalindua rubra]|uniref:Uncharacterized protein n=1 Tax=Candidatus Scalindua rubra TaxID=1872076 RepID=A0A1E3X761_9BACT|nr:MAG: hypothetical protein SCARUB_03408 [Candidatus Scalindua rubra]
MNSQKHSTYYCIRRTICVYLCILLAIAIILGMLHCFFADIRVERVSWLNLDKERNISTWFSGLLFFLLGCSAFVAYYQERKNNAEVHDCFRLPILWLGIGLSGLFMSLDDITILHENLFWREIRLFSEKFGDSWIYVTQWQILFAPAILLILSYFVIFLSNRFGCSLWAKLGAFTGIGCWLVSLSLEGMRGMFKLKSKWWYSFEVLIEEEMEMMGTIFLLSSIIFYTIDIALDFTTARRHHLKSSSGFLTRQAVIILTITLLVLSSAGGAIYYFAYKQASVEAPLPRLYKKAKRQSARSQYKVDNNTTDFKSPAPKILSRVIWFGDIKVPLSISNLDQKTLIRFVAESVFDRKTNVNNIPAALMGDTLPRMVFLSVSDGINPAYVVIGTGKGITDAIELAVTKVNSLGEKNNRPKWFKLDIVQDVYKMDNVELDKPLKFERSLQGMAFDRESGIAFLPEEMMAYTLVNSKQKIRMNNIEKYLNGRSIHAEQFQRFRHLDKASIYRFTTMGVFSDGKEVISLYRGHRLYKQLSKEDLLSAARRGGQYLTLAVSADGKFVYRYLPKIDHVPKKYNILRHAGTVYSMLELYEITGKAELLKAACRAIEYLLLSVKPCLSGKQNMACIVEKGYAKLGGNALTAIALAKYTEVTHDRQYMPILLRLGRWIQSAQRESGEFYMQKQSYPDGEVTDFISQYYPGEALLAMTRIYALDPHDDWLDVAEKGTQYLINNRDYGLPLSELIHDHWLLYALNELYRYRPNPLYLEHALQIAHSIMQSQNREPVYPDWRGSYYRPPRSTPTATRTEGSMLHTSWPATLLICRKLKKF